MGRTYLRSANTQDVNDIEEKYANFASYTGINESKSFIDVDQNSFEEANNVYVNIDNELSTRPPVNSYSISVINSSYDMLDVFKVNGITFYKYARPAVADDFDYLYELTATGTPSVGDVYYLNDELNDEGYDFVWVDGESVHSSGTVLITFDTGSSTYVIALANYTAAANTITITADSWSQKSNVIMDLSNYVDDMVISVNNNDNTNDYILYIVSSDGETLYTFYGIYDKSDNTFTLYSSSDDVNLLINDYITIAATYTVGVNSQYCITWNYNDVWVEDICSEDSKVFYIQNWYVINYEDTIYAYKYDVENSVWKKYELDDLIYIPTLNTISGASTTTEEGAMNLFTSAYKDVYLLQSDIITNTDDLVGETVTLELDGETFTLVWKKDYIYVLSKSLGVITYRVDTVISATSSSSQPIYIAYCDNWLDESGEPGCYYSITGDIWSHVNFPEDVSANSFSATISQYGQTIWIANYATSSNTDTIQIYYGYLPSTISSTDITPSWYSIEVTVDDLKSKTRTLGSYFSYQEGYNITVSYSSFVLTANRRVLIYSREDDNCVLYYGLDSYSYNYNVTYTSDDTTTTYSSGSNLSNMFKSAILVIITSYVATPYITTDSISTYIAATDYDTYNTAKIRLANSTDSYNLITLSCIVQNSSGLKLYMFDSVCDDFEPFLQWSFLGSSAASITSITENVFNLYYNSVISFTQDVTNSYYEIFSNLQDGVVNYKICCIIGEQDYIVNISHTLTEITSTIIDASYFRRSDFNKSNTILSESVSTKFVIYPDTSVTCLMTDSYIYSNGSTYNYFEREGVSNYLPVAIYTSDSSYYYVYWSSDNNTLYSTDYGSATVTRIVTSTNDNTFTEADVTVVDISFANELYTTTIATQNLLYQATAAPDGSGKLYFRTDSKVELPDTITGMIYFSQTVLAIFVPYTAFEYTASSGDDGIVYYYLYPTKLVLGNREDYDILQSYDGSTIYICTERGMAGLTYETLVSSTEHIFSYLTDNIFTSYKNFDEQPILFCQYVRWIFMYRLDSRICYIYDMSGSSWWKWTLPYNITKIYADTDNDKLLLILNSSLYYFNFDADDFHDMDTIRIDWSFKSQKLHLSAPNNYKHLRWLSVVTTQDTDKMRYKLKFTNYRHWHHMQDSSVVEYEINQLGTMRKKINFVKCNAFQFEISNDKTWKQPEKFVISNIAIKYRITEGIR